MRPRSTEKEAAIRDTALKIISEEGLEQLSMQKLAMAAGISPRTIYIKYRDKEDLLLRLYLDVVLDAYEQAVLANFDPGTDFAAGIQQLWLQAFRFLKKNKPYFALIRYGQSSPMLNKAFREDGIRQGQYFAAVHQFIRNHIQAGRIPALPLDIYRAMLFAPMLELVNEYFDHRSRPRQIITERSLKSACQIIINGFLQQ